jgi:hypothetical protein
MIASFFANFVTGPLPWFMSKEFSTLFLTYHAMFTVSLSFNHAKLHKRFVSTACPDPFCGANGPAPEGCVAVFCTSSRAGAALEHYHIPAKDLSPAPPRKKNQECLILDGSYRGQILTISQCSVGKKTAQFTIKGIAITLRFDQICLVQRAQNTM